MQYVHDERPFVFVASFLAREGRDGALHEGRVSLLTHRRAHGENVKHNGALDLSRPDPLHHEPASRHLTARASA
ncbi:MAG TPA: hypothetical protein VIS07_01035 [Candidatus Binatia bacterium]